jgi:hypothetical protein
MSPSLGIMDNRMKKMGCGTDFSTFLLTTLSHTIIFVAFVDDAPSFGRFPDGGFYFARTVRTMESTHHLLTFLL